MKHRSPTGGSALRSISGAHHSVSKKARPEDRAAEIISAIEALPDLRTDRVRSLRRAFSKSLAVETPKILVRIALTLIRHGTFASRFVAYELVYHHRAALASLRESELTKLGAGLNSWGSVDTFALYLAGPAWRERQVGDSLIHKWAWSNSRWWRRAALVSTVPLNNKARGGSGDAARTLDVCGDRDDMVVKGLSWALRELAKRDAGAVRAFIANNRNALAARVIREVENKLSTGLKTPKKPRRVE